MSTHMQRWAAAALTTLLVGCTSDGRPRPGADAAADTPADTASGACTSSAECDDSVACTVDGCGVDGVCTQLPIDSRCAAGEVCDLARGCVAMAECAANTDCDDTFECTVDMCAFGGVCEHVPVDDLCPTPGNSCVVGAGCVGPMGCTSAADCDDAIECTIDGCGVEGTCTHMGIDTRCADGEMCATSVGCTRPCSTDEECQDEDFCNGREVCMPEFGCAPAPAVRACDDTDDCTVDACSPDSDMCVFACDRTRPACDCPAPTGRDGVYSLTPAPAQTCAIDGMGGHQVDFVLATVEFSFLPGVLSVRAALPRADSDTSLTQIPPPPGDAFDVSAIVGGGCEEHYRLRGMFTGADTFDAVFTADFVEAMPLGCFFLTDACVNQSVMVTGTRAP